VVLHDDGSTRQVMSVTTGCVCTGPLGLVRLAEQRATHFTVVFILSHLHELLSYWRCPNRLPPRYSMGGTGTIEQ